MKMRKGFSILLSGLLLFSFTSCSLIKDSLNRLKSSDQQAKESSALETESATQTPTVLPEPEPTATPEEPAIDAARAYLDTLEYFYQFIVTGNTDIDHKYGTVGIAEQASFRSTDEALESTGFAIIDLSGDGLPELIIGEIVVDTEPNKLIAPIYAVFTLQDNEPVLTFSGWYRNAHFYHGDGRFYQYGSNGAIYQVSGIYKLSSDGLKLNCEHFFFSYEKDESLTEIGYYYNTICKDDKSISVELSEEEIVEKKKELASEPVPIELIPFAEYPQWKEEHGFPKSSIDITHPVDAIVTVDYASDDLLANTNSYDKVIIDLSEAQTKIVFTTDNTVKDFKYLEVLLTDCVDDTCYFDIVEELYSMSELRPERPLVIGMEFIGSIPNRGISFIDETGIRRYFSINQSGKDGSVFLLEFEPTLP